MAEMAGLRHSGSRAQVKITPIPSIRVTPEFLAEVEAVLAEGETLSQFVSFCIRAGVERRRVQAEFVARGLRARETAHHTGEYVDAHVALDGLQRKLEAALTQRTKKSR